MHYVYIIRSDKSGRLYKGCTDNLRRRLDEHNKGYNKSTKAFVDKADALREELFLKSGKGKERVKYLLKNLLDRLNNGRFA